MWLDGFVSATAQAVDERVQQALYARGVMDEQIAGYRLGYIDRKLPPDIDYPQKFVEWARGGEKLDDSIVMPLTNAAGDIKGLQFRHVEQEKKGYSDFIVEKGEAVLFGLGQAMTHAWTTRRILLVEGGFDLFPVQRFFPEVVSTLTAHLPDSLVRVLRRTDVSDIWLGYDSDKTGRESTQRVKDNYREEFQLHELKFPREPMPGGKQSKDPSDLWELWGETRFGSFIRPLIERGGSTMERF